MKRLLIYSLIVSVTCLIGLLGWRLIPIPLSKQLVHKIEPNQTSRPVTNTLVIDYWAFGPQASSYELIGFGWYQWNSQGPDDPQQEDDVKVVVYRNVDLESVKKIYPVIKDQSDYRYIEYHVALKFLDEHIADMDNCNEDEPEFMEMCEKIASDNRKTRTIIIEHLGS